MINWLYTLFSDIVRLILIFRRNLLGYTVKFIMILLFLNLFLVFLIHIYIHSCFHLTDSICRIQQLILFKDLKHTDEDNRGALIYNQRSEKSTGLKRNVADSVLFCYSELQK